GARPGLDRDAPADAARDDRLAVGLVLGVEQLPARERDDARRDRGVAALEELGGLEGELELRARRDEEQLRRPARVLAACRAEDIAAARNPFGGELGGARERRQLLACQGQRDRPALAL